MRTVCFSWIASLALAWMAASAAMGQAWPQPVEGFQAPKAGEHPRLLFRQGDITGLRAKAGTPVGQAMVARLKYLLGGGEAMPAEYNPNPPINIGPQGPAQLKPGAFTVNHAAGFGLLYQLTGEKKYADLARQCLDKVFAGQVDRDERYSWKNPGTGFRLSGVLQGVAIAYDLCYDAWPQEYRQAVVREIQTNAPGDGQKKLTLEFLAGGGKYPPSSNHYGAYISGPGFAALAIKGDPGADDKRLEKILSTVESSMKTVLTAGYGDGGWFGEGTGSDKTACLPGLVGLIQSMRIAAGKDWCVGAPNARQIVLTRLLEFVKTDEGVVRPPRGVYAHGPWFWPSGSYEGFRDRGGWSADGVFAIGIGALPAEYRPGMVWLYENFVEPGTAPQKRIYEARIDPIHAVYAFVNWPIDAKPANPAEQFPLAVRDSVHGYVLCRNGFTGANDVLYTALARTGPTGYHKILAQQDVWIWAMGYRVSMGSFGRDRIDKWTAGADGSATFVNGTAAWAIDYSRAAGCDAVIATTAASRTAVEPPMSEMPKVPDDKIDLSGQWTDGSPIKVEQNGNNLTCTFGTTKQTTKTATLEGRKISLVWGPKTILYATVSDDAQTLEWSNGGTWDRVVKRERWSYKPGELVKPAAVKVGSQQITIVTFAADGKHPEPTVEGNSIRLGNQTVKLADGELGLSVFKAAK